MKTALITGVGGQDGSYLAEHLLRLGYRVFGTLRGSTRAFESLENLYGKITFLYADMRDQVSVYQAIKKSEPDEIYNLAGQVFVPTSWDHPEETFDVNVGGLTRILGALKQMNRKEVRVYQASSSEMFGNAVGMGHARLSESAFMSPESPYGVSKYAAHKLAQIYSKNGFFVSSGILFNHESPRRGSEMVTRKISMAVASWAVNTKWKKLTLGNMHAKRDWGFAGDYVKAMHLMLQQDHPGDFVIGTGQAYSVSQFLEEAIKCARLPEKLCMSMKEIIATRVETWNKELVRTNEIDCLLADAHKANRMLSWEPATSFEELVKLMVDADIARLKRYKLPKE